MTFGQTTPATRPTASDVSKSTPLGNPKLGKDEFVKLLLTQLQHQDPTAPQDSQAFVAQLAQFAGIELAQQQSSTLEALLVAQAANNQTATANLVGKEVVFRSGLAVHTVGSTDTWDVSLASDATTVTAVIKDADGNTVRTLRDGPHAAGSSPITWDGLDDKGQPAPAGTYTMTMSATDATGAAIDASTTSRGSVSGISFVNGFPELIIGSLKIKLSDVVEVREPNPGP